MKQQSNQINLQQSNQSNQSDQHQIRYLSPELLLNPSFETGFVFPDNWSTYVSGTAPTFLYPVTPGNDNQGVSIGISYPAPPAPAPTDHSFTAIMQPVDIDSSKTYHITGYISTETLIPVGSIAWDTGCRIMVDWRDSNNTVLSTTEIMSPIYGNPVGWTRYEYSLVSPDQSATKANIVLLLSDVTGTAYFDDLSFRELASITITYPSSRSDTFVTGNQYDITWAYSGNEGTSVSLDLYKNNQFDSTIVASTSIGTYGSGTYSWQLPTSLIEGTDYIIRITNISEPYPPSTADSNPFTIQTTICPTPISDFTFQVSPPLNPPRTVYFDSSLTSNNPTNYSWYFDDGLSSTEVNPFHTYQSDGTYLVSLQTSNSCGYGTTAFQVVTVGIATPTVEETSITTGWSQTKKNAVTIGLVVAGIAVLYYVTKPKEESESSISKEPTYIQHAPEQSIPE